MVLQRNRRKQHRHGRRGGYSTRHREARQIGAQQVEVFLKKGEPHTTTQIRGIDHDQRPGALLQVGKGGALEDAVLVEIDGHLGATTAGEPPRRAEQAVHEFAGDIAAQERLLEITEQRLAVQPEIRRRETAPGDRADQVHLIEETTRAAVDHNAGVPQFLQHAVGQCRRAGAAAGKRQHQRQLARTRRTDRMIDRVRRCRWVQGAWLVDN